MTPEPTELILPASLAPARAIELLSKRLALTPGRASRADRVFLDSFDGRLRGAGLHAEAVGGELVLYEAGAPVRRVAVRRARRYLVSDIPPGVVRDRVADVLGVRALLPRVRLRSEVVPVSVLDGDSKTVVRVSIERATVSGGEALAPRLLVRPVLGYDRDYERVLRVARDRLGFVPADRSLYDAAVRAVGGRPAGIKSKPKISLPGDTRTDVAAQQVLHALADIAEANLPGALEDLDSEFLHDLRTSIRRARSVLRELKGVHPAPARARVRDELKWAQQLTGPVRDLDVQLLEWDSLAGQGRDLDALRSVLKRRRAAELTKLRRGLRSKRFAEALRAWRELADTPPPMGDDAERPQVAAPIHEVAGARIRKVYRRMVRDGSAITDSSPPEDLHDLRKRGKELRYLLELFGGSYPEDVVKPMISTLRGLQDVLGHFQDRATQALFLRGLADELAAEPGGPATLMALGSVLDTVDADQAAARSEFAEAFRPFADSSQRKLVAKTFPKRP